MIEIGNIFIEDEIIKEHFVCDLQKCKGGCCVDGDAGAPLEDEELKYLSHIYPAVAPYLTEEGRNEIEKNGFYLKDPEFGYVTPIIRNGMCAYGYIDKNGIVKCGIEKAFNEGKFVVKGKWKKPISCHLFPIRTIKNGEKVFLSYEPRSGLCDSACALGKKLQIPVFQFLKAPIIQKFGKHFFHTLEATAKHLKQHQ